MTTYEEAEARHKAEFGHKCNCFGAGWSARMDVEIADLREQLAEEKAKEEAPKKSSTAVLVQYPGLIYKT